MQISSSLYSVSIIFLMFKLYSKSVRQIKPLWLLSNGKPFDSWPVIRGPGECQVYWAAQHIVEINYVKHGAHHWHG